MVDALKEFFATRERGAAWVFRVLISLVMIMASIMGTLSWHILTGIESKIDQSDARLDARDRAVWQAIAEINKNQNASSVAEAQLAQTVADQIRITAETFSRLSKVQDYQEQRLHNLETAPKH